MRFLDCRDAPNRFGPEVAEWPNRPRLSQLQIINKTKMKWYIVVTRNWGDECNCSCPEEDFAAFGTPIDSSASLKSTWGWANPGSKSPASDIGPKPCNRTHNATLRYLESDNRSQWIHESQKTLDSAEICSCIRPLIQKPTVVDTAKAEWSSDTHNPEMKQSGWQWCSHPTIPNQSRSALFSLLTLLSEAEASARSTFEASLHSPIQLRYAEKWKKPAPRDCPVRWFQAKQSQGNREAIWKRDTRNYWVGRSDSSEQIAHEVVEIHFRKIDWMNELREIVLNIVRNRSRIHHSMRVEKIEKQSEADRIVGLIDAGEPHDHALSKEFEFFSVL